MKKFILSIFVIGCFALYAIYYGSGGTLVYVTTPASTTLVRNKATTSAKTVKPKNNSTVVANNLNITQNQTSTQNVPPKIMANNDKFKNGEYTGDSVDAYYGYIQVKAVITNGKLSDVVFLDYPQDRGHSIQINNYAMPILKSEAIKAQDSNVNTVSGATDSSGAFRQSLSSALALAKI